MFGGREKKGTFVGTKDYLSPEMVDKNISGPFSDLWALGIIIYVMYNKRPPWDGKNQLSVLDEISNARIEYPESIPPDAVELLQKLLNLNPAARMNLEVNADWENYDHLKRMKYFNGIDFEKL